CRMQADAEAAARTILRSHRGGLTASAPEALRARCQGAASFSLPAPGSQRADGSETTLRSRSVLRRWAPLSLAATILLAVAGVFVFGLNNRVEALASSLVVDHVKCFAMTSSSASADPQQSAARWQQEQGWSITVANTDPTEQLRLENVRRCLTTDGRAAHLQYSWRGAPLSVYVLQENAGRDCVVNRMGHEAAIWCA